MSRYWPGRPSCVESVEEVIQELPAEDRLTIGKHLRATAALVDDAEENLSRDEFLELEGRLWRYFNAEWDRITGVRDLTPEQTVALLNEPLSSAPADDPIWTGR